MLEVYSDFVHFKGDHYDFGYVQGKLLENSPILPNRRKQWKSISQRQFHTDTSEFEQLMKTFAPYLLDEIQGLADGLEINVDGAIREFGGYYKEYGRSGCTIFTDTDYMIRNYDNDPLSYEGRFVLFKPTSGAYATIGPSMQITGRTDGMNEKGLAIGFNFINTRQSHDGFICNMIARIVLETCANIEEAVMLLKEIPHRHAFSYVLIDQTDSVIVEASPRAVVVRRGQACANHFDILTEENRYRMDDSLRRVQTIEEQQGKIEDMFQAYEMMNRKDRGVFSSNYGAWSGTIHTAIYNPKNLTVGFALGGNRPPFMMEFNRWLQGDKWNVTRMKGYLDTDIPFVNMVTL